MLKGIADVDVPQDVGDFRLIDRKVARCAKTVAGKKPLCQGIDKLARFRQTGVEFVRDEICR